MLRFYQKILKNQKNPPQSPNLALKGKVCSAIALTGGFQEICKISWICKSKIYNFLGPCEMLWHFYGAQKCEAFLTCSETVPYPATEVAGFGTVSDITIFSSNNHQLIYMKIKNIDISQQKSF